MEDGERRDHVAADLRRPALLLDRLRRARPVESRRRLGRHRRERQRSTRRVGRRRVQEPRRRRDMAADGPRGIGAHREDRRRSARRRRGLRGRRGPALVFRWRSRALQDGRWRRDVVESTRDRREHRDHRCRDRSPQPRRPVRRLLSAAAPRLVAAGGRTWLGDPQIHGRRRDLAAHRSGAFPRATWARSDSPSRP